MTRHGYLALPGSRFIRYQYAVVTGQGGASAGGGYFECPGRKRSCCLGLFGNVGTEATVEAGTYIERPNAIQLDRPDNDNAGYGWFSRRPYRHVCQLRRNIWAPHVTRGLAEAEVDPCST